MLIRILSIGFLLSSLAFTAPRFYPDVNDTALVFPDPLGLSQSYNGKMFSFSIPEKVLHNDSSKWKIDGKLLTDDEYISNRSVNKTGSYDPKYYSVGQDLILNPETLKEKYGTEVHRIDVTANYLDTVLNATWFFKYQTAKYSLIKAKVSVDTVYSIYESGWKSYTELSILAIGNVDTSIYEVPFFGYYNDKFKGKLVYNDTANLELNATLEKSFFHLRPGDTLDCFVLQYIREGDFPNEWDVSKEILSEKHIASSPFPFDSALKAFNDYLIIHDLYKGYTVPEGKLKIGPFLSFHVGDAGWKVTAKTDGDYWFITHMVGRGDCPARCTLSDTTTYKVSRNGEIVVEECSGPGCAASIEDAFFNKAAENWQENKKNNKLNRYNFLGKNVNGIHDLRFLRGGVHIEKE